MRQLLRRAWYVIRRRRFDADLREELDFHRASIERDLQQSGADFTEARFAARRAIGSVALAQDDAHDVWVPRALQGLGQDVRLAFRSLRATPVVTAVAILSLALGIGANTAIFSLVDSLVLRALPVKDPERLAVLDNGNWTNPLWEQLRQVPAFDGAFAWGARPLNLTERGETVVVNGIWASGSMFNMLGVPMMIGRPITEADDNRDAADARVTVVSYAFWQRRLNGAADVVGRTVMLEHVPFTIIGVTGAGFFGPDVGRSYDVAIPIAAEPAVHGAAESWLDDKGTWWLEVMVRLRPGQTIDEGTTALRQAQRHIVEAGWGRGPVVQNNLRNPFTLVPAATGMSDLRQRYERPLTIMLVVVALVLLIACANIANLLLARSTARQKEWSVRLALGATRTRLARLLLTESLVLTAAGAAAGVIVARWAGAYLVHQLSAQSQGSAVFLDLAIDWRVLVFTGAVAAATTLLSGTASAFRAAGVAPMDSLKEAPRGASSGGRVTLLNGLLVAQVAFSIVLLVAAGLFIRTFRSLATLPLGFSGDRVLTVTINTQGTQIALDDRLATYERIRERVLEIPGVASAGVSRMTMVSGGASGGTLMALSGTALPTDVPLNVLFHEITPGWLSTLGTPLIGGRDIDLRDGATAPRVALVNEAFARTFLGGRNPIGHTVQMSQWRPRQVVGIVADAVYRSLRAPVPPTLYIPFAQSEVAPMRPAPPTAVLSVRSATDSPALLSHSISAAIAAMNPDLALTFRPLTDQVDAGMAQERLVAVLSAFFGGLALLLAALGLYGVTSYAVSRRRTELGIRMALGAAPAGIVRLVMSRVLVLVATGVIAGTVASLWASRFVATLLFGLEPRDPVTLAGAAVTLAAVAALAAGWPAWRASRIDPAVVLRND
jgi:putative ABC transport system permease protein